MSLFTRAKVKELIQKNPEATEQISAVESRIPNHEGITDGQNSRNRFSLRRAQTNSAKKEARQAGHGRKEAE